jgi:hypothetical protein
MTQRTKQKIEYTLATHAIERLIPSKEALHLCEKVSSGAMNADAAVLSLLKQYGLEQVHANG